jgi:hypothetical protein
LNCPSDEPFRRLQAVRERVERLGLSLKTGDLQPCVEVADEVVVLTTELLAQSDQRPLRDPEAEAEYVSALHLYRNAAFAFRSPLGAEGEIDPSKVDICRTTIEQGHDHFRLYVATRNALGEEPA